MQKENLIRNIEEALATIRPFLNADGGDISFVELTDDMVVKVKLEGACHFCPLSLQTLKGGVETAIKQSVPEVIEVIAV